MRADVAEHSRKSRERQLRRRLRIHSVLVIGGSILGAIVAAVWFPPRRFDLALLAFFFTVSGVGISVGYHRLLTHRSFEASCPLRYILLAMGATAGQGPPSYWAILHRTHHRFSDRDGDPHSPFSGFQGRPFRGFAHAHAGWIHAVGMPKGGEECTDLYSDKATKLIGRLYIPLFLASVLLPATLGYCVGGSYHGAIAGALWGGAVRLVLVHNIVWSVNSVCHQLGNQPYATADQSRNVWWLSVVSFGESWHNNHHVAAGSARFGIEWWQLDIGYLVIRCCELAGLAHRVRVIPAHLLLLKKAIP
jgi:stearoyl-CoA desaturase (Delta-9 desaturase)